MDTSKTMVSVDLLLENAIAAALAAIEIYNKPNFKYRDSTFTILMVNAWELLLKARILKNAGVFDALLVVDKKTGKPKITRSGNPMTHEITYCLHNLELPVPLKENVERLIELRDTVVHLCPEEPIQYLVYTLAAASVRNFEKACKDFFERSLAEYNFYILPLSFASNFTTFSSLDLSRHPLAVKNLIDSMAESQNITKDEEGYRLVCVIHAQVISAKKLAEPADLTVAIDPEASEKAIIRDRPLTDIYPHAYADLWKRVKGSIPGIRMNQMQKAIKALKLKENKDYSHPNFLQPKDFRAYAQTGHIKKGTTFIYKEAAVQYLVETLKEQVAPSID